MSEPPRNLSLEEFIIKQKQWYHDTSIKIKTMAEATKDERSVVNAYTFYSWIAGLCDEIESLYTVIDNMTRTDKLAIGLSKSILGFSKPTPIDEIETRAKDIGGFFDTLMNKRKEWELEEEEKKRNK